MRKSTTGNTACDDTPDRLGAWLRLAAADTRTALSGWWAVFLVWTMVRSLLVLANVRAWSLWGHTAIVVPSLTGGKDDSYRALITHRAPMCRAGGWHRGDQCNPPIMRRMPFVRQMMVVGGWITVRRWRMTPVRERKADTAACWDPSLC